MVAKHVFKPSNWLRLKVLVCWSWGNYKKMSVPDICRVMASRVLIVVTPPQNKHWYFRAFFHLELFWTFLPHMDRLPSYKMPQKVVQNDGLTLLFQTVCNTSHKKFWSLQKNSKCAHTRVANPFCAPFLATRTLSTGYAVARYHRYHTPPRLLGLYIGLILKINLLP